MEIKITFDEAKMKPKISFMVDDISDNNNESLLRAFAKKAKETGMKIVSPRASCGSDSSGKRFSYTNYEIILNDE